MCVQSATPYKLTSLYQDTATATGTLAGELLWHAVAHCIIRMIRTRLHLAPLSNHAHACIASGIDDVSVRIYVFACVLVHAVT